MKTPPFIAAAFVLAALAACGSPDAQAPTAVGGESSLEPIDAVPLPLDDNPLVHPPVAAPAPKAAAKTETPADAATEAPTDPATAPAATPAADADAAKPPRVVVRPREPVAAPTPAPASPPAPARGEPEKPVLTF